MHTADWQIGRLHSQFDAGDAAELANGRIESVRRIAALATGHAVDAVLVAGDVFDSQTPREKTVVRLFEALAGYDGPWLLLPGNHDAALAESVWQLAQRLGAVPPNAILCLRPEVVEVTGRGGSRFAVLPAPLTQRHTHTDLTDWFDQAATSEGLLRIGLAHGSVAGILPEDVDSPNPIAAGRAARARLDYLALGDWHGRKQVDDRTWYSGTHEPERFRDNDPGHVLLVEIDAPGTLPRVSSIASARYRWLQLRLDVTGEADVEQALEQLAAIDASTVADVVLGGTCDLAAQARLQAALEAAERNAAAFTARQHDLRLAPTEADLQALHADGFVGEAVKELRTQLEGPQAELAREALLQLARIQRSAHAGASAQGAAA
nr:DNA repair exonuclease [Ramlibacter cellulosilyticus]